MRSTVAMLGTLVSLVVIGVLGWAFTRVGHFTGQVDEGSQYISGIAAQVDLRGLLLAGLVIGQEVVRGLVGGLGILAAVPVTTAIAALVASRLARERTAGSASSHRA